MLIYQSLTIFLNIYLSSANLFNLLRFLFHCKMGIMIPSISRGYSERNGSIRVLTVTVSDPQLAPSVLDIITIYFTLMRLLITFHILVKVEIKSSSVKIRFEGAGQCNQVEK